MSKESIMDIEHLPSWRELKVEAIRLNLDCNDVFVKLDDETIAREFNYIGPDRFPKWLRETLARLHSCLLPAVLIHDLDYYIGGTKEDFHAANRRLNKNMKRCLKANRSKFGLISYWVERIHIRLFYKLCEKYGFEGWNKTNEENEENI